MLPNSLSTLLLAVNPFCNKAMYSMMEENERRGKQQEKDVYKL